MTSSTTAIEFISRVSRVPFHGLGLSVDAYQPDLLSLLEAMDQEHLSVDYLEIFKASSTVLSTVRRRRPRVPMEYHGEGLWLTQPDLFDRYPVDDELTTAAEHLRLLGSSWANYECASKEMAGFAFGTYLPPLLTKDAARIVARHAGWVQTRLDDHLGGDTFGPLLLLETPPLTYFAFGDLDMADFFRLVTEQSSCGIVLDIGHIWTVYRYGTVRRQNLGDFLTDFLDRFPLERVIHLHVAGLHVHDSAPPPGSEGPLEREPWWIDSHGAPIPSVLFDLLDQVLRHPHLTQARGLALEVDTKHIPLIADEFRHFRQRFEWWSDRADLASPSADSVDMTGHSMREDDTASVQDPSDLLVQYRLYAEIVTGQADPTRSALPFGRLGLESLARYRERYLPHEILHWGGDVKELFPQTCRRLEEISIALEQFVAYWFTRSTPPKGRYDFFLMKLDRFTQFVRDVHPPLAPLAEREAAQMRAAYEAACLSAGNA